MKIAVILGAYSLGARPINLSEFWTSDRGATGTDLCFMRISEELSKLGHEVVMISVFTDNLAEYKGMKVVQYKYRRNAIDESFDAVISLNEPEVFRGMCEKPKKIVYQMLNDFSYCKDEFDSLVDTYIGVCEQHTDYLRKQTPKPEKWQTVKLGCDPDLYEDKRVPGRVIWCSSADRGLHWLLQEWSEIKKAVPIASLRIFYHFNYIGIEEIEDGMSHHPHSIEMGQRVRYMKNAIQELKKLDVEHIGSVSRERMIDEFNQAYVFAFPCDTIAFSEGFSCSTLESHASFTAPVITDVDCLGGIYKESGAAILKAPVRDRLIEFRQAVISALTTDQTETIAKCRKFAKKHSWKRTAKEIEKWMI